MEESYKILSISSKFTQRLASKNKFNEINHRSISKKDSRGKICYKSSKQNSCSKRNKAKGKKKKTNETKPDKNCQKKKYNAQNETEESEDEEMRETEEEAIEEDSDSDDSIAWYGEVCRNCSRGKVKQLFEDVTSQTSLPDFVPKSLRSSSP